MTALIFLYLLLVAPSVLKCSFIVEIDQLQIYPNDDTIDKISNILIFCKLLQATQQYVKFMLKKRKILNFSNALEIHNAVSKVRSQSKQHSHSPLNKTLDLSKQPILTDVKNIEYYKANNRPQLSDEKMATINYTLSIDATTQVQYQKRILKNELYVHYDRNPFKIQGKQNKENLGHQKAGELNIITALSNLRQKNNFSTIYQRAPKIIYEAAKDLNILSKSWTNSMSKNPKQTAHPILFKKEAQNESSLQNSPFDELDSIVNMKQTCYITDKLKQRPINIFKINFDHRDNSIQNCKEILKRHYLCFESTLPKTNKEKSIDSFKFLSQYSRMLNTRLSKFVPEIQKLNESDFQLDINQIGITQIIYVASGKLQSAVLFKFLSQDPINQTKIQDTGSNIESKQLFIGHNKENLQTIYQSDAFFKHESKYYGKEQYLKVEKDQKALSELLKLKLEKVLKTEKLAYQNGIKDTTFQQRLQNKKNKILLEQLNSTVGKQKSYFKDIDGLIRMNKIYKNKTERIKTGIINETLKSKRDIERKFKGKSINMSLANTWW